MALFGGARDISLFRHVNRELMGDIITQQCAFYKYKIEETKVNLYGEAAEEKYYMGPVLLNCLIERGDQEYPETDLGTDFNWGATFKFLRDDLLSAAEDFNANFSPTDHNYGAELVPEVGDIMLYNEGYYEVDNVISNQYYMGKNPDYPNQPGNWNPDFALHVHVRKLRILLLRRLRARRHSFNRRNSNSCADLQPLVL